MSSRMFYVNGQELHLEKPVGKGGEGEVFPISNMPGFAVKAYLPGIAADREKKIRAMIASRLADAAPMVAFPNQLVVTKNGSFAGFLMKLVENHKEIHELQTPSSRLKHFPKADYRFLVRVGLNIARVFAQIHSTGCVVGDINQRGILVSNDATVTIIDADSFQVTSGDNKYLCVVGVPEYTPPELQGKDLKSTVRTTDHDAFGLAVCVFQLLCMDRHPFSGRYSGGDIALEKAISEFRFAYSNRSTGMTPPTGTVRLKDFTPRVAQYFEDAFSPQKVGQRPTAAMWVEALSELETSLRVCTRKKVHYYSRHATECPWCRMEAEYGTTLFVDGDAGTLRVPPGRFDSRVGLVIDLAAILAAVNALPIPASITVPVLRTGRSHLPGQAAVDAKKRKPKTKILSVLASAAALGALGAPAIPNIGVFFAVMLGLLSVALFVKASSRIDSDPFLRIHGSATDALTRRVSLILDSSPIELVVRKKALILGLVEQYKQLVVEFGDVKPSYDAARQQKQLDHFLSQCSIRNGYIPRIGSADIANLASYGFTTAFDAKRRDVQVVQGIGPAKKRNIMDWVRRMEARFVFQPNYSPDDQRDMDAAQQRIFERQQDIEERITKALSEYRQEFQSFERWKATINQQLIELVADVEQAEVDLAYLDLQIPPRPAYQSRPVPDPSVFLQPTISAQRSHSPTGRFSGSSKTSPATPTPSSIITCPSCGSVMVRRTARHGRNAGNDFWGCSRYPQCTGTRPI